MWGTEYKVEPRRVVDLEGPAIYRKLRQIFGPSCDIDDIYQNVMIEILRSLPALKDPSKLRPFLRRITWNVAYQEMRLRYRRKEEPMLHHEASTSPEDSPEALAQHRESCRKLYRGLEALEPKLRAVLVALDLQGMSLKECSETLGRPIPTIQSQQKRGRALLAKSLRHCSTSTPRKGSFHG